MRIGIVGAGAIGGFIAAALAQAGVQVSIVARGAHLAAIQHDGLRVESDLGTLQVRVDASDDLRDAGPLDALLLTFKAHQWPAFIPQLTPFAGSDVTIATLQNGLPFWFVRQPPLRSVDPDGRIAALFPDEQIVGGVVHVSGHVVRPGVIRQSGGMRYPLGVLTQAAAPRVERLAAAMRSAGLAPEIDADIRATTWLKLVNNAGLNSVSALHRMTLRAMLDDARARAEVRGIMEEALEIGQALGVVGAVDVEARLDYAARLSDVKTSMLQDLEAHRPLELDPILGSLVELAERTRIDAPRLRDAYDRLRAIERSW